MKCSKCKKDFEQGVKTAYKLGLLDGEDRVRKTINAVLKSNNKLAGANQDLAEELLRLDQFFPLQDTPSIIIPLKKAKQIRRRLPKSPLKTYFIKLMRVQLQNLPDLVDISVI